MSTHTFLQIIHHFFKKKKIQDMITHSCTVSTVNPSYRKPLVVSTEFPF